MRRIFPERVSNPQSHDRLDILVAYTATAAENWADRGGAHAAIRHAVDYMKMVFRNNRIEVEPHIVHIVQASAALDRTGRDLGLHLSAPVARTFPCRQHVWGRWRPVAPASRVPG